MLETFLSYSGNGFPVYLNLFLAIQGNLKYRKRNEDNG
jgi:hypothetical protein